MIQILSDEELDALACKVGWRGPMTAFSGVFFKYARAIESAVIAKLNSAEPVCWITPDGEGWRMRHEPPVIDTKLGWSPLYEHPPIPFASAK